MAKAGGPGEDFGATTVRDFPIVGIGASAGGLAAFEAFFSHMPAETDSGFAFVIVQHLDPDHKSVLTDLVQRYTRMEVFEVTDGIKVLPNRTYIIPPNKDLALLDGRLQLLEPAVPRGRRLPIDFFFRSLAQDRGEQAVCLVMSGNGTDGTLGLRAVKESGGMAMVQDPETAEYDGMPRSAISTGLADYVVAPASMPEQLMAYTRHSFLQKPEGAPASADAGAWMQKIIVLLRAQTKHDFSHYKQSTVRRRVERRMAVTQVEGLEKYVRLLQKDTREVEILFREFLIGVTGFFRDPGAFELLRERVLPQILDGLQPGAPVRAWVPGCSTGEEAYSLAILLQEEEERLHRDFAIQIFATDIDPFAVDKARAGLYPASIAADVSPERLAHYFVPEQDDFFRIRKSTRDLVIFAEQDIIKDPPFSKIDLISCRNLLIYMEPVLQKKILSLFHYALSPGGFLLLGTSESVGDHASLFTVIDRKWKVFKRRGDTPQRALPLEVSVPEVEAHGPETGAGTRTRAPSVRELTEHALLRDYAPTCVAVNAKGDIQYVHGRTGAYLEIPPGEPSANIVRAAREGLKLVLSSALRTVASRREPVRHDGITVKTDTGTRTVSMLVRPADALPGGPGLTLVIFEEQAGDAAPADSAVKEEPGADSGTERVAHLERELRLKEEALQAAVEELETSNEELKSTNEELQSTNEELQSTNEELETSKEELQSVNEELITVNTELQQKIDGLSRANNDMSNLLAGTGIGTLYVDSRMRIQRFTPAVTKIVNLIQTDVGRPVSDIASNLSIYDRLTEDVQAVLDTLIPREAEVQTREGRWYLMRILPYRTLDNVIEGTVLTFVDVTEQKRLQESLRRSEQWMRMALGASGIRGWSFDLDTGRVSYPEPGSPGAQGLPSLDRLSAVIHPGDRERVRAAMEDAVARGAEFRAEFRVVGPDGERRLLSRGTVSRDAHGRPNGIVGIDVDITESRVGEQ
jgi:two-component system, chemotaxis family, CheB/CheR fusion protein